MFVFEGLAYDLGAAARRRRARRGRRVRDGLRAGRTRSAPSGLEIQHAVTLAQPRRRLRARRAADVRRRRRVGLAREPAEHRRRGPRPARAARAARRPPPRRARRRRARRSASPLAAAGLAADAGDAVRARALARDHQPRPAGARGRRAASASRTPSPGLLLLVWWLLPFDTMNAIAGRELEHGLLGLDRQRPDGRRRRDLADRLQRRRPARARRCACLGRDPRARAGAQDGDGLSRCASRFRTGVTLAMFTLVVFTIVVGATTSRRVPARRRRRRELRRRLRRRAPRSRRTSPLGDADDRDPRRAG